MTLKKASFDPAQNLDLFFRKGRNGSKVLTFLDSLGAAYDLTGIDLQFRAAFDVTETILTNTITLDILSTANIHRETYFWELYNATSGKTWLCGTAHFTETNSAEVDNDVNITIELNGELVEITINESGGTGDVNGGTP